MSRELSYILRHNKNKKYNIDKYGWASTYDILFGLNITIEELKEIVSTDDKQRYSFNEDESKIRANQGHSFNVDLNLKKIDPPFILYHGTKRHLLDKIMLEGLKPMNREYVHLSKDIPTAQSVSSRRDGDNVILEISARKLSNDRYPIYISENGIYLIKYVPPEYISV